jgi:hypothetical protein
VAVAFARLARRGTEGFLRWWVLRRRVIEQRSSLALVRGGVAEPLAFGSEATINLRGSGTGSVDAPMVFVGYGLRAHEQGIDDFAGVDLRGKVAVVLSGLAPQGMAGPALAAARSAGGSALFGSGAVGVVSVLSPRSDLPGPRGFRLHPQMRPSTRHGTWGPSLVSVSRSAQVSGPPPARRRATRTGGLPTSAAAGIRARLLRATVAVEEDSAVSQRGRTA